MLTIIATIFVLGIAIFVHEFGHFLFAKLFNVKVEKFSIGMGKKLIGKKIGETEYMISIFPIGGYVKLAGEDIEDRKGDVRELFSKPPTQRIIIFAAGSVFNIILGFFLFALVYMIGVSYYVIPPIVGDTLKGYPAYNQLLKGDKILEINNKKISDWEELVNYNEKLKDTPRKLKILRNNKIITLNLKVKKDPKTGRYLIGITPPPLEPVLGKVVPGTEAYKAGLQKGDRILQIENKKIETFDDIIKIVVDSPGKTLKFKVLRNNEILYFDVYIQKSQDISSKIFGTNKGILLIEPPMGIKKFSFKDSIIAAYNSTLNLIIMTILVIIQLIKGQFSFNALAGPVGIISMLGYYAKEGLSSLLHFTALLSVNLGILNLLPIPALDGSYILFTLPEYITKKPLSEKIYMYSIRFGMALLLTLFITVTYNDIFVKTGFDKKIKKSIEQIADNLKTP